MVCLKPNFSIAQSSFNGHIGITALTDWEGWAAGSVIPLQLRTEVPQNIEFFTNGNAAANQRMTIMGFNNIPLWGNNTGFVGIGNNQPLSMLHLGNVNCYNGQLCGGLGTPPAAGWRPWMTTGTFMCGVPGVLSSDQMYVGLMNVAGAADRDDAVISWGDNIGAQASAFGPDNLRFIFSEYCLEAGSDPTASGANGLEVMRLMPYIEPVTGNFVSINAGIGNYFTGAVIPPMRRLEVLDGGLSLPQLRLTFTQNANINTAIFTDFQTTGNGNLNIRGFSSGAPLVNGRPTTGISINQGRTGFNLALATEPQNTVEINSGIVGTAGLRYTNLNSGSTQTLQYGTALSVDVNGDVILVPSASLNVCILAGQLNFISKWSNNTLPGEICQSKIYEDNITHNVGIDYLPFTLDAKLKVSFATTPLTKTGIFSQISSTTNTGNSIAILGKTFYTSGNAINFFGVRGESSASPTTTIFSNYGVYGLADGTAPPSSTAANYGVYGYAQNAAPGKNHGVHGKVNAIGVGTGDWAGFFEGDVFTTGLYYPSDAILKENVLPIQDALNDIRKLQPKTFNFKTDEFKNRNLPLGDQIGLIEEDVVPLFPQLTREIISLAEYDSSGNQIRDEMKFGGINYIGFIAVLIAALKEEDSTVQVLSSKIDEMQTQLDGCCSNKMKTANDDGGSPVNQVVELKSDITNYLGQSVPNPHGSQCTIPYSIDANVTTAEIVFVDELGRVIQQVEIVTRGKGQLTVLSSNLEDGVYNYSLVLDGKIMDTKRMIKQH